MAGTQLTGAERPEERRGGLRGGERVVPAGRGGEPAGECEGPDHGLFAGGRGGDFRGIVPGILPVGQGVGQAFLRPAGLRGGIEAPGSADLSQRQVVRVHPGVPGRQPTGGFPQCEPGDESRPHRFRRGLGPGVEPGQRALGGGERGEPGRGLPGGQAVGGGLAAPGGGEGDLPPGGEAAGTQLTGAERPEERGGGLRGGERVVPAGQGGEPAGEREGAQHRLLAGGQLRQVSGPVPEVAPGGQGVGQAFLRPAGLRRGIEAPGTGTNPRWAHHWEKCCPSALSARSASWAAAWRASAAARAAFSAAVGVAARTRSAGPASAGARSPRRRGSGFGADPALARNKQRPPPGWHAE